MTGLGPSGHGPRGQTHATERAAAPSHDHPAPQPATAAGGAGEGPREEAPTGPSSGPTTDRRCHACGTSNPAGFDYCGKCRAPIDSPERDDEPAGLRTTSRYIGIKSTLAGFTARDDPYPPPGNRYVLPEQMNRYKKHCSTARGRGCVDPARRAMLEPFYCAQVLNNLDLPQWFVDVARVIWCEFPQYKRDSGIEEYLNSIPEGEPRVPPPGAVNLSFRPTRDPDPSDSRVFVANAPAPKQQAAPKRAVPPGEVGPEQRRPQPPGPARRPPGGSRGGAAPSPGSQGPPARAWMDFGGGET